MNWSYPRGSEVSKLSAILPPVSPIGQFGPQRGAICPKVPQVPNVNPAMLTGDGPSGDGVFLCR
jgi:hypothetical protein